MATDNEQDVGNNNDNYAVEYVNVSDDTHNGFSDDNVDNDENDENDNDDDDEYEDDDNITEDFNSISTYSNDNEIELETLNEDDYDEDYNNNNNIVVIDQNEAAEYYDDTADNSSFTLSSANTTNGDIGLTLSIDSDETSEDEDSLLILLD